MARDHRDRNRPRNLADSGASASGWRFQGSSDLGLHRVRADLWRGLGLHPLDPGQKQKGTDPCRADVGSADCHL